MKKVLALVLALAMVLGCFSFVSAAEYSDVAADADYHDAAAVLSDLGVASGYTDGTFKPEKVVTRAEMAAFIVKALGIAPAASATTNFSDVPASHWASGYIAYATSLGIVSGYTDGTFKPDQTVSYDQAITMLIQALGYTADSLTGTYPAAYVSKAKTLGILEDVEALGTAGANRGDVAQLLYNTLGQSIGHTDKDGAWTVADPVDNMFSRLGAKYSTTSVVNKTMVENAVIDISEYLGAEVVAVRNKDYEVVAIYEVKTSFVTDEVEVSDAGKITEIGDYTVDCTVTAGAIENQFQNGYPDLVTVVDEEEYTFAVKISGKHITEIVSVLDWNVDAAFQVEDDDLEDLADEDEPCLRDYAFKLNDDDEIDTDYFVLTGVDKLADIKEDDVVFVYANYLDKITKVEVCSTVVTGKVTKLTNDGVATVNGEKYEASEEAAADAFDDVAVGEEFTIYMAPDGDVFAVEPVDDDPDTLYGIVLKVDETSELLADATLAVKLYTAEGKTEVYYVDDDIESADTDMITVATPAWNADYKGQVVTYALNKDGQIVEIKKVTLENKTAASIVNGSIATTKLYFDEDTVAIKVDEYNGTSIGNDTDDFAVVTAKSIADLDDVNVSYVKDSDTNAIAVINHFA